MNDEPNKINDTIVTVSFVDTRGEGYMSEALGISGRIEYPSLFMGYLLKAINEAVKSYDEIAKDMTSLDDYLS